MSLSALSPSSLTPSQLALWMGQAMAPESPMYNMAMAIQLPATLDAELFSKAWDCLVEEQDSLHLVFGIKDGAPYQAYQPGPIRLEHIDLRGVPEEEIRQWQKERCQQPFDLAVKAVDSALLATDNGPVWYLNQHHLITDAWGITTQFKKLAEHYDALASGQIAAEPLPLYLDYTASIGDVTNERVTAFWSDMETSLPGIADFNTTVRHPAGRSKRVRIPLTEATIDLLTKANTNSELRTWTDQLTQFNVIAAALMGFLYRLTGQQQLAIGTPAHNRTTAEHKITPGLFMELFPLTGHPAGDKSFLEFYQEVRDTNYGFLRYAQPGAGSVSLARGYNVVLNFINATFGEIAGQPVHAEWVHPGYADAGHHLRLQVYDFNDSGALALYFDLNEEVFSPQQRAALPGQFARFLEACLTDIHQPIGKPALTAVAISPNERAPGYQYDATVLDLLAKGTAPNTVALQQEDEAITYGELWERVDQLAAYLQNTGVQRGDLVPILLPRSTNYIISVLAVLKAGGAFVPVATSNPAGRVMGLLEDAQVSVVISQSSLVESLPEVPKGTILLDTEAKFIASVIPPSAPAAAPKSKDLAYVLYTSGSTGLPKGVMINHQALSLYLQYALKTYGGNGALHAALFTSIGFDLTITSTFLSLISGGTLHLYPEPLEEPDLAFYDVLADDKVNFLKLTPAHLSLLFSTNDKLTRLESLVVGGENFSVDNALIARKAFGQAVGVYNEYGPTEATVGCIVRRFAPEDAALVSVPIGKPLPFVSAQVLDAYDNPVPAGVIGELYLGGDALAQGYFQQLSLTEASFRVIRGKRMYATGDLVSWNGVGEYFEYHGRKDEQVKIGGRRVEPAEIERAITQFTGGGRAIVEPRSHRRSALGEDVHNCARCGLPANYPGATFDDEGVCHLCQSFTSYQNKIQSYFREPDDLKALLSSVPAAQKGKYDCLLLLSGGKDSSYALAKLREMGFRVLAFTLDNGYISEEALDNVRNIAGKLNTEYVIGETEAMNEIFVDSLERFCNVCDGCFKTIYTLAVQLAAEKNIPFIITGLSRGQFFETRLTEELFNRPEVNPDEIDAIILQARKAYHQVEDAVKRLLDTSIFDDGTIFERIRFVDFYRYTDVSLAQMLTYLKEEVGWERPSDTGRSTNCLINQAGIYVHKKERGYSNYAFPYSWDVRVGHKTRDASLEEINEEIDEQEVARMLREIGYVQAHDAKESQLVAYYVAPEPIDERSLLNHLRRELPVHMIPVQFIHLKELPINANGKIDRKALPMPDNIRRAVDTEFEPPRDEIDEIIQEVWSTVLQVEQVGIQDNFLEIGGDSLRGIRIVSRLNDEFELELPVNLLFRHPTVASLSEYIQEHMRELLSQMEE